MSITKKSPSKDNIIIFPTPSPLETFKRIMAQATPIVPTGRQGRYLEVKASSDPAEKAKILFFQLEKARLNA